MMDVNIIIGVVAVIVIIIGFGVWFKDQPKDIKIQNVKEALKWFCVEAEKNLGGGTGQLKLRYVYNLAIQRFPWIEATIPFETFSTWVDEALVWVRQQLETNTAINDYVNEGVE